MIKCEKCLKEVSEKYEYCPYCGNKIESINKEYECITCLDEETGISYSFEEPQWILDLRKKKKSLVISFLTLGFVSLALFVLLMVVYFNTELSEAILIISMTFMMISCVLFAFAARYGSCIIKSIRVDGRVIAYSHIMNSKVYIDGVLYESSFYPQIAYLNLTNGKRIAVIPLVRGYYRGGYRVYDVKFEEVVKYSSSSR